MKRISRLIDRLRKLESYRWLDESVGRVANAAAIVDLILTLSRR